MQVVVRVTIGDVVSLRSSELSHLDIVQQLGEHTTCTLLFTRDRDTDLSLDTMLGQALTITVEDDDGLVTTFDGVVDGGTQSHQLNHGSSFTLRGVSHSHALERRRTAHYPASSAADVMQQLGAEVKSALPAGAPLEYVQFGESDFEFLCRLASEQGAFVRTSGRKPEVRIGFDPVGPSLTWGRDLLAVSASGSSINYGAAGAAQSVPEKRDHRFRGVRGQVEWLDGASMLSSSVERVARQRAQAEGDALVRELPFRSKSLEEGRRYLEQDSARALGSAVLIECQASNPRVRAGDTVTLAESDAFALPTRGTFGVVRVSHEFDGQLYTASITATPWMQWSAEVVPSRARIAGPCTGMVVDNVDPKHMGRICVRLRWQDAGEQTRWLRMVAPYAGNARGLHFLPEIGDEVLVAFELGDPERPIVMGSVWNGKDVAPTTDRNAAKRIVTRSGNTIQFFDEDSKNERIEIYSASGQCWVQLANNGGKPLLTVHSEGDIAFEAKNEIRLTCKTLTERVSGAAFRKTGGDDVAEVGGNFTRKVGGKLVLQAMNIVAKAGAMLDAAAGGILSIMGSQVHIQPPGKQVPSATVKAPAAVVSPWKVTTVPNVAAEKTSADARRA